MIQCCGCRGMFPDITGPIHRYMSSVPGCWAAYGEVLAKEYNDPTYFAVHQLTVDAYAVQHPGGDNPQARQSVTVHLATLWGYFEQGLDDQLTLVTLRKKISQRGSFPLLESPSIYPLTVLDVAAASTADQHCERIKAWALAAWQAWSSKYDVPAILGIDSL